MFVYKSRFFCKNYARGGNYTKLFDTEDSDVQGSSKWLVRKLVASFCVASLLALVTSDGLAYSEARGSAKAANKVKDPSFEHGIPKWKGSSTYWQFVICDGSCDISGFNNHARTGDFWAWFGGNDNGENATKLSQKVRFPSGGSGKLSFYLYTEHHSGNGLDQLSVYVDNDRVFKTKDSSTAYDAGYTLVEIDVGEYCDGAKHRIRFRSTSGGTPSYVLWAVDDVSVVKS